ncbi:hypothetical protein ACFV0V_41880, partial [Streptomyces bottropensis]
ELTGTTAGTNPAVGGDHPALPAPTTDTTAPALAPSSGATVPELAPAPAHPVPAPAGTTAPAGTATSEETGPRTSGTAAAHTHTAGTITVKVPNDSHTDGDHAAPAGTTDGDHTGTEGTTPANAAPANGPRPQHPGATGPVAEGRYPEMDLSQGANSRAREYSAAPARPDIDDVKLAEARDLARGIIRAGSSKVSRRSLKAAGLTGKTETVQALADLLNEEIANGELVLDETA